MRMVDVGGALSCRWQERGEGRGFGLLETVVAIGVIMTGLFAVFTLVLSNQRTIDAARLRFGGTQAAREGVEVVRLIRDSNWLAGRAWDDGIIEGTTYAALPVFDPDAGWSLDAEQWTLEDERAVITRSPDGFWAHPASAVVPGTATPYRRIVTMYPICALPTGERKTLTAHGETCDETAGGERIGAHVAAMVRWNHGGSVQDVTVEEEMYDWR